MTTKLAMGSAASGVLNPHADLAQFASSLTWEQLPPEVCHATKTCLLDAFACMFSGSGTGVIAQLLDEVREWNGAPQSTVAVFGDMVPAPFAAMVNAAMLNALDDGCIVDASTLHRDVCVIPALLAAAEARTAVSGKELLTAYVAGLEVSCRLARPATRVIAAGVGATAAAGRIMNLDAVQLGNAMSIAYNAAGGHRQAQSDGAFAQDLRPAFYAQNAVTAARLAQKGVAGPQIASDGIYGLFPLVLGDKVDLSLVTEGLGARFNLLDIGLWAYPCARDRPATPEGLLAKLLDCAGDAPAAFAKAQLRGLARVINRLDVDSNLRDLIRESLPPGAYIRRFRDIPLL